MWRISVSMIGGSRHWEWGRRVARALKAVGAQSRSSFTLAALKCRPRSCRRIALHPRPPQNCRFPNLPLPFQNHSSPEAPAKVLRPRTCRKRSALVWAVKTTTTLVSCNTQFFTIDAGWALIKNPPTRRGDNGFRGLREGRFGADDPPGENVLGVYKSEQTILLGARNLGSQEALSVRCRIISLPSLRSHTIPDPANG